MEFQYENPEAVNASSCIVFIFTNEKASTFEVGTKYWISDEGMIQFLSN